ncbi:hypothetical protein F511_25305 [Dorcoceras hygrometricum]|uniref:Uncharacterized protein n=1 Tax=Dorcoceras hygrometricum TaxID=472368 RepID=A0A2Z7CEP8_9LAMI|nr:hypothetical protein F511_25305 [Dorcoceras hygrometricum]
MSYVDDRIVVEFVRSLGSPSSSEGTDISKPSDKASRKMLLARINADEARLTAEGRIWYEVKASLLQESDKAIIRDLSGMSDHYEILIPLADDRAHLPPGGYHSFYLNHLEMGHRFPVPRFIQNICDHLKVSPSQLTPNSYSSLLALGVLLRFFRAPLSIHLIYNLNQIRQQDVGKFFIRLKPEFGFIKGNPTSHKGCMSRGVAWHCDMSWSEKPTRRAPPLPTQEYDPATFLNSVSAKCFNAQDLIREDLLCHFGFSRKGIVVKGDLADRIMKAYLLEAFKKQESEVSRGSNPPLEERANPIPEERANPPPEERAKEKRKRSSSGSDKRSKKKTSPPVEVNKEVGTSPPEQSGLEVSSFIARPITTTIVAFFQNFVPELDLPVVSSASDQAITEGLASKFLQVCRHWSGGQIVRWVTKAREVAYSSRRSLDEMMAKHDKLMREIEDVRGASDAENRSLSDKMAASEASDTRLWEERNRMGEEAEEKMRRMQEEAEASWAKRKEDFLKSAEFDRLCSNMALYYFRHGFNGCLAQFRSNGYAEAEHPASFLNVLKALEDFPEEDEVESSLAKK